ncbi:MAG: aldo/keto reductase [Candidatus Thorarchaeota archaeon]
MKQRSLGKTGFLVSEIGLGTWQLGGKWGDSFNEQVARNVLYKALELGITFYDTADVYRDGLSEHYTSNIVKSANSNCIVATKAGRRLHPHNAKGYNEKNLREFINASLNNMECEKIDLLQLHCPPTAVYSSHKVFEILDTIQDEGLIRHYGVSVETVDEALKAIEYPNVATVQIIFNMFRLKPSEKFFIEAKKNNIGVIVRVPLASGLLTGKFSKATTFGKNDHRFFNREGKAFNKGETFSGVNYDRGIEAINKLKEIVPPSFSLPQFALKWILMFDAVSTVIPGASREEQVLENVKTSSLPELSPTVMNQVSSIYDEFFRDEIHQLW